MIRLGEESIPPGEADAIDLVVRASELLLDRDERPVVRRDQHPKHYGCVRGHLGEFPKLLKFVSKRIASPLTARYWSTTPSLFGEGGPAVKFSAVPTEGAATPPPADAPDDYLREAMRAHLDVEDAHFEFRI